jgi:ribosomal protein S21
MTRIVIEVKKGPSDNNMSLLRKFQRRMNEVGIVRAMKKRRFNEREESSLNRKAWALKRIEKRKEIAKLKKLGKIQ